MGRVSAGGTAPPATFAVKLLVAPPALARRATLATPLSDLAELMVKYTNEPLDWQAATPSKIKRAIETRPPLLPPFLQNLMARASEREHRGRTYVPPRPPTFSPKSLIANTPPLHTTIP